MNRRLRSEHGSRVISLLCLLLPVVLVGKLLAATIQYSDVIVNHGQMLSSSRVIEIDATKVSYPQMYLSLGDPRMQDAVVLRNPGKPVTYTLPERNGRYWLNIRFADENGVVQPELIRHIIELDTIPPVVDIFNPKNNSTTDQGFVHLQATAYDPPLGNGPSPGSFHSSSTKVWINGERYWNRKGDSIDIPRFEVNDGTNTLSIVAEDEAGNRTEASVHWFVDLNRDTTAPRLLQINLHPDKTGTIQLPDDEKIFVQGILDDSNAIVTATVNRDPPQKMNVKGNLFFSAISLYEGENQLVLSAIDGAGNAADFKFVVIRSNRYKARITSLDVEGITLYDGLSSGGAEVGTTAVSTNRQSRNSPQIEAWSDILYGRKSPIVSGYVSALRDEGETNEARLVSVTVDGVPTVLGVVDQNGNVPFRTLHPVPLRIPGGTPSYDVEIRWSDGVEFR